MARRKHKRRPMAEINVVPYIDVMLVMLVIFMVTAPLLTQGVRIELPQATAEPLLPEQTEPLEVIVDAEGHIYMSLGSEPENPVDAETLVARTAAVLRRNPKTPVLVRGDRNVDYGIVVHTMTLLQKAGARGIGLVTETPEEAS